MELVGSKTTKAQERPVGPKALAGLGTFLYPIDLPTLSDDFAVIQRSKARHWPAHVTHGLFATCTLTLNIFCFFSLGIHKLRRLTFPSWN